VDIHRREYRSEIRAMIRIITSVFIAVAVSASSAPADPLEAAVLRMVSVRLSHHLNSPEAAAAFISEVRAVSAEHDVPAALILAVSFRESSWKTTAVGGLGEVGIMQTHGVASRGCELLTRRGQLDCGTRVLAESLRVCGSWERALSRYATGQCKPLTDRVRRIVADRMKLWKEIEGND
jgi:soluble lytic murein transglycosylase-like protein